MNIYSSGRDRAIGEVMSLQVGGMTNLWDGLKTSLDLLTNRGADMAGRNGAVMLLTDGVPNVDPPRGYVPTLQRYKDKAGEFRKVIELWGLLLYTSGVLFLVEWCIRKPLSSSIISFNATSITHDQYTDIYSLINIYLYLYLRRR